MIGIVLLANILRILLFTIIFGQGLVAAGSAVVLFQIWREQRDGLAFIFFLLLACRALETFIRVDASLRLSNVDLPRPFVMEQVAAALIAAIPVWLLGAYLFGLMRKKKKS